MKKLLTILLMIVFCTGYGQTVTDIRDGRQYRTIKINNQEWLAENLQYGVHIPVAQQQKSNELIEYWLYNDTVVNGGYYTYKEATGYGGGDICPDGWHIPTIGDIEELRSGLGKTWDQFAWITNENGFDFLLGGYIDPFGHSMKYGYGGYFWVVNPANLNEFYVYASIDGIVRSGSYLREKIDYRASLAKIQKHFAANVRCVKDDPILSSITFKPLVENRYTHTGDRIEISEFFGSNFTDIQYVIDIGNKDLMLWISYDGEKIRYKKNTLQYFEPGHEYIVFSYTEIVIDL